MSERNLGKRAPAVFEAFLDGRDGDLHPADRAEAAAFWNWLGEFERPGAARKAARTTRTPPSTGTSSSSTRSSSSNAATASR